MLKWFLIGCGIVAVIVGVPLIWDELSWRAKENIELIGMLLVAAALVGFLVWFFYTGFTS